MRRSAVGVALILGMAAGYSAMLVGGGGSPIEPSDTPRPELVAARPSTAGTVPPSPTPVATVTPRPETYLIWASGGLPPELVEKLAGSFEEVTIVKGDLVELAGPERWVIPLDALAFDPVTVGPFDAGEAIALLEPGTVVLGQTSAELRGVAEGDEMMIEGVVFRVAGVVPDAGVAAAEVVFRSDDPSLPVETDRYALIRTDLSRPEFERHVRSLYDGPAPLRIRSGDETPWMRHGDAVLPQARVKEALGEFLYTGRTGSTFEQHPAFRQQWILTTEVPLLGEVTCHETVIEMLAGAMNQLIEDGLDYLVDPSGYRGCWNPRLVRTVTGAPSGLSRHSWGAAVDINAPANPLGSAGTQDERLVEVMQRWGFTWGGDWVVPDPMHFEYGRPAG